MISADVQKLEPGNVIRLYEVDGTAFGADTLRFHAYGIPLPRLRQQNVIPTSSSRSLSGGRVKNMGRGLSRLKGWICPATDSLHGLN
ncbi:hypothetical protein XBI1_350003 [Xenorhabdus bovienii str. Intermedium]|uniref:Uncharacterized protein n=1 Tax=Xenorhabdus bovienii str. Intermedium TaxID=1379677 RepID=A0A077QEX2_XENBV|nr:hypothetical protein XBI1_350003 [Xenorhabdus bovienii str. Intermedium]